MPIYHGSDSERLVAAGANMVWRDVGRHRSDATFLIGPSTKAKPYRAPYMLALEHGEAPMLTGGEQLFLPSPTKTSMVISDEPRALAPKVYNHVLPLPLVDRVIATSRASWSEPTWYPSTLRIKWAERELKKADEYVEDGSYHAAACVMADVFGTLLAGFLASRSGDIPAGLQPFIHSELEMFRKAWAGISLFVDGQFFMENLLLALSGKTPSDTKADPSLIARLAPKTKIEQPVGTPELVAAERLDALEKQIKEFENKLADAGLPIGAGEVRDFELYNWKAPGQLRFRIASKCFEFTRRSIIYHNSSQQTRRVVWVFDRNDHNKLKCFEWPRQVEADVVGRMRESGPFCIGVTPDYPRDFVIDVTAVKLGDVTRFNLEVSEQAEESPLTPEETSQLPQANRDRLVGYFNGRFQALEKLARMRLDYENMCQKYLRAFDAAKGAEK